MLIDRIELHHVRMPLVAPFNTAFGDTDAIESVLVAMHGEGSVGWGEAAPWAMPLYSPEFAAGVFEVARRFLGPAVVGREIADGPALQERFAFVKGNPFARAALDTAWWDLAARLAGEPLWRYLGGAGPEARVGADFGVMESVEALLEKIGGAVDAGFERIKLKYRPGWEIDVLERVREAFPDTVFHVDCNSAYSLDDRPMLRELDRFSLAMIEQPLAHDDLLDHAALAAELATPVCLDESITGPARARQALEIGAAEWINIKPGRCGGITPAIAIHDLCAAAEIPVWIGGMLESAVGASHCLALATLPNVKYPSDVFPSERFYDQDLAGPPLRLSGPSRITARDEPGIGAVPDPAALAERTVQRVVVEGRGE